LRLIGGVGAPRSLDDRVAAYLLDKQTFMERDALGRQLVSEGVDARELDALRGVAAQVARDIRPSRR
jgi:hypothetical protein